MIMDIIDEGNALEAARFWIYGFSGIDSRVSINVFFRHGQGTVVTAAEIDTPIKRLRDSTRVPLASYALGISLLGDVRCRGRLSNGSPARLTGMLDDRGTSCLFLTH